MRLADAIEELCLLRPDLAHPLMVEIDRARRQAARYRVALRAAEDNVTWLRQQLDERKSA